jgi:hypothetical protein
MQQHRDAATPTCSNAAMQQRRNAAMQRRRTPPCHNITA